MDLNSARHPQGKRGTFTAAQVSSIRAILADLDDVVQWGGDWTGTPDEMHFEIRKSVSEAEVRQVALRLITAPPRTITVKRGDGWWQTARRAGVPMADLLAANGATVARVLHPGDVLKVSA